MKNKCTKRVIVDVDVGTDDYLALMILLHAEKMGDVKIEAIVCSNGNTTVDNVCKNLIRLLEIVGRTDIPVFKGASRQLILPKEPIQLFHGEDGFGDLIHDKEPDLSVVKNEPAALAVHNIVVKNPTEISLICVGALTNLALAIKLFDDLVPNIKDVWIMGGNHSAVGNITASAEFNFYVDPEAAYIVFECLTCPIYLLPWETCLVPEITFEWRYNVLEDKSPAMKLLTRAERAVYDKTDLKHWLPCDAFLTFIYLNPEKYITKHSLHHATIELYSSFTRGQVVLDHLKNKRPNVTVIEQLNADEFKVFILKVSENL